MEMFYEWKVNLKLQLDWDGYNHCATFKMKDETERSVPN